MIGQIWSSVFKSVVRRGWIEEGVLGLQVTLSALSICLQWTEALSCLLSLLPVYKTDTDYHSQSHSQERSVWSS